uniref:Uncharacterized protein LOC102806446 n=1 Tax=Saccoglossus kowalevskii TaxID=10224 RepID=A0ABM0MFJ5_SACKO|nr:PREDICTED: uncharacterized protein LOC102806446 [Saccoglossus kowalevskii]
MSANTVTNNNTCKYKYAFGGLVIASCMLLLLYTVSTSTTIRRLVSPNNVIVTRFNLKDHVSSIDGDNMALQSGSCSQLSDIGYIFNRKTGSTTLVTIFSMFAKRYKHNLQRKFLFHKYRNSWGYMTMYHIRPTSTFIQGQHIAGIPRTERKILPIQGSTVHVESVNENGLNVQLKTPNTVYVSIVREPVAHFASVFAFFHLGEHIPGNTILPRLTRFLNNPTFYRGKIKYGTRNWRVARNSQAWHLGLDHKYHDHEEIVEDYFSQLDKEIDLILINEYYDESLILLKRIMCWKMVDILYISRRVRTDRFAVPDILKLKIHEWNNIDVKIYERFNRTLWQKIKQQGPYFETDLLNFRQLKSAILDDCNNDSVLSSNTVSLFKRLDSTDISPIHFCKGIKEWYTLTTNLEISELVHSDWGFSVNVEGQRNPLQNNKATKVNPDSQCININFHKRRSRSKNNELDIYMSFDNIEKERMKTTRRYNNYTVAMEISNYTNIRRAEREKKELEERDEIAAKRGKMHTRLKS